MDELMISQSTFKTDLPKHYNFRVLFPSSLNQPDSESDCHCWNQYILKVTRLWSQD